MDNKVTDTEKRIAPILNFHLVQETPMIHFQAVEGEDIDGEAPTLRGTDVKPRLDKFLYKKYGKEELGRYVIDKDHAALDYKLNFQAKGTAEIKPPSRDSGYFGNLGDQKKFTVFFQDGVDGKIICFHADLMDRIQKSLAAFFFFENFGTREDKGFGSFRLDLMDGENINVSVQQMAGPADQRKAIIYQINQKNDAASLLDQINMFYKLLKSGINARTTYRKALLTKYMWEKNLGGEKRFIKQKNIGPAIGKSHREDRNDPRSDKNYRYIRAMLGTTDVQTWKKYENSHHPDFNINIAQEKQNNPIERFQSPMTFSVYKETIFLIAYEPSSLIYNQTFSFSSDWNEGELKTPSPEEFSMRDFLDFVSSEIQKKVSSSNWDSDKDRNKRIGDFSYFGGKNYAFHMKEVK